MAKETIKSTRKGVAIKEEIIQSRITKTIINENAAYKLENSKLKEEIDLSITPHLRMRCPFAPQSMAG